LKEKFLYLRYHGTDFPLMVSEFEVSRFGKSSSETAWENCFTSRYKKEFGFHLSKRDILIDDIRVRGESVTSDGSEPIISNGDRSNGQLTKAPFLIT